MDSFDRELDSLIKVFEKQNDSGNKQGLQKAIEIIDKQANGIEDNEVIKEIQIIRNLIFNELNK